MRFLPLFRSSLIAQRLFNIKVTFKRLKIGKKILTLFSLRESPRLLPRSARPDDGLRNPGTNERAQ